MYVRKPEKCTLQKPYFKVRRNLNAHPVYTNFVTVGDGNFAKYMLHCIRHCDFFSSSMTSVLQAFSWIVFYWQKA